MPSATSYRLRFGSLLRAYDLIGYTTGRDYRYIETNRFLRTLYPGIILNIVAMIEQCGGSVAQSPATDLFTINDEFTASIVIARSFRTPAGALRWKVRFDSGLRPDITVALRMDAANLEVLDYYLLPRIDIITETLRFAEENGLFLDAYRFETLAPFFELSARTKVRTAA